jgi:threonine dehydrogenase-like Zn-dependent dehydrogenase
MKAVVYRGPGSVAVDERPEPAIEAPGDVIVRVSMATICGTDMRLYGGRIPLPAGTAIGHEFCGIVEDVGASVRGLRRGQRVASPFSVFCGGCFYCKQGLLTACERRQVFGFAQLGGAQAEYVRVPSAEAALERLPDAVGDEQAVMLSDLLPGVFAGLQLAGLRPGDSVAVVGCGPTGLAAQLLARTMGAAAIFGIDRHGYRRDVAASLGGAALEAGDSAIDAVRGATEGRGADIAADATGTLAGLSQAVRLVRPWGAVINLGGPIERSAEFPIGELVSKHARLIPAGVPPVRNYMAPLIHMLERGAFDPSPIASHVLPLAEAPRGYAMTAAREDGVLKVLLRP